MFAWFPIHIHDCGPITIVIGGLTVTVTVTGAAAHPFASVTLNVYVVVVAGLTVTTAVLLPPGIHEYVYAKVPPFTIAVSVVLWLTHIVWLPLMLATNTAGCVTVPMVVDWHP